MTRCRLSYASQESQFIDSHLLRIAYLSNLDVFGSFASKFAGCIFVQLLRFASTAGATHTCLMAIPTVSSRSAGPYLCALFAAFTLIFVARVHFMEWDPGQTRFTVNQIYTNERLKLHNDEQEPLGEFLPTVNLGQSGEDKHNSEKACESSLVHLEGLGLSQNIKYTRRCIKPVFPDDMDRNEVRNISSPLITTFTTVNLDDQCSPAFENLSCEPFELPVPKPDPESFGQYAHLLFGVATSSKRLRDSKDSFAHWLANSGATLICMITDGPIELLSLDFAELEAEFFASGVKLKLFGRQDLQNTPEQSHMMLIRDMLSYSSTLSSNSPHWLGILDDDTFFPSLYSLSTELARRDHTRSQYLGALTESSDALNQGILAAWGGAGIFLSLELAQEIEPHLDGCLSGRGGDMLIMECIHAHSHARLTAVEGLWQMDFMGDTAGIYESGRRMLSMHHWKSWHWLPVEKMATVTRICGECFLERFVFDGGPNEHPAISSGEANNSPGSGQGVMVLNVGYSINMHSEGLPDLSRVEQTWDGIRGWEDYEWSVGPLRPRLGKHQKKTWWLKTAFHDEKGGLSQIYLHEGRQEGKDDEVIELIWAA